MNYAPVTLEGLILHEGAVKVIHQRFVHDDAAWIGVEQLNDSSNVFRGTTQLCGPTDVLQWQYSVPMTHTVIGLGRDTHLRFLERPMTRTMLGCAYRSRYSSMYPAGGGRVDPG